MTVHKFSGETKCNARVLKENVDAGVVLLEIFELSDQNSTACEQVTEWILSEQLPLFGVCDSVALTTDIQPSFLNDDVDHSDIQHNQAPLKLKEEPNITDEAQAPAMLEEQPNIAEEAQDSHVDLVVTGADHNELEDDPQEEQCEESLRDSGDLSVDQANVCEGLNDGAPGPNHKKNQKKHAAAKRKKKKNVQMENQASLPPQKKSLAFGEVEVLEIERSIGWTAVPAKGSWPLGLSEGEALSRRRVSLEEYELERQQKLQARYTALSKKQRKLLNAEQLETRQFDFKMDLKNPLFTALSEEERKVLLIGPDEDTDNDEPVHTVGSRRSSALLVLEESDKPENPLVAVNQALKEELSKLYSSRESTGCSCAKVKNIDKLHQTRLKEMLMLCGCEVDSSASKKELLVQLKTVLEGKSLCELLSCECFRAGVQCHADVCGCCYITEGGKRIFVNGLKKCGNSEGLYLYQLDNVSRYRKAIIEKTSHCSN